jgi:HEAT repeat protein
MNGRSVILVFLVTLTASCTKPTDQAENYYNLGKYDLAFKMANQAYTQDKTNVRAAIILWKSQIAARNCTSQNVVANAYSSIREAVANWDERIIKPLEEALNDRRGCVRLFAVYALGDLPYDSAAKLLLNIVNGGLSEPEEPGMITGDVIRGEAALVLGKRAYKDAFESIVKMTQSENGLLRAKAAEALGYMRDERAVDVLKGMLKDEYSEDGKRIVAESARSSLKLLTGEEYEIE